MAINQCTTNVQSGAKKSRWQSPLLFLSVHFSLSLPLSLSLFSGTYTEFIAPLFYFYCLRLDIIRVYVYTYTLSRFFVVATRTLTVLSVREVFLSLDFPPGIITSRSAQIRDYSLAYWDNRTKSARACGTSTEEIFLTARCHRVRPTEITDEDSERSSTPVTVQERAGVDGFPSCDFL